MNTSTIILSCISMLPWVGAATLGIANQPNPLPKIETAAQEIPERQPITVELPRFIQLNEVNISASLPKKVEKKLECGDWRKTKIQSGWVRECEYK